MAFARMKTVAIIALLAASRLTAVEVLPVRNHSEGIALAAASGPLANCPWPVFTVSRTGSLWPMVRGGDVVAISPVMPGIGELGVFYYRPSASDRAKGAVEEWKLHICVRVPSPAGNRYSFRALPRVGMAYPVIEYAMPADVIGTVRKVWRVQANSRQ